MKGGNTSIVAREVETPFFVQALLQIVVSFCFPRGGGAAAAGGEEEEDPGKCALPLLVVL